MSFDAADISLEATAEGGRYVLRLADGPEAELVFSLSPSGAAIILHTETPPNHRGRGIAAALVARAVADFRAAGRQVIPLCGFARGEMVAHPGWSDLLRRP